MWHQSDQHFQPRHFQLHHREGTQNPLIEELHFHPSSMITYREGQDLEQIMAEAKFTTWRQRYQMKQQQSMKLSIRSRNLEDVTITATPDLLCFELVTLVQLPLIFCTLG